MRENYSKIYGRTRSTSSTLMDISKHIACFEKESKYQPQKVNKSKYSFIILS